MNKLNFNALAKALERLDDSDDGREGRCGNWELRLGGYDHGYGIYYKGQEIGRVNYEWKEYELYHEDFMPKDQIPEFLAAIDARRFKDVEEFEDEDEEMISEDGVKKRKLTGARSHITKDGMRGWSWDPKRDGYYITKNDFPEKFMDKFVPFLKGLRNEHCELDMWANSKNRLFIRWVGEKTKDKHWWHKLNINGSPADHEMASFARESLKEFVEEIEKFIEKSDLADVIQVKPNWRFWEDTLTLAAGTQFRADAAVADAGWTTIATATEITGPGGATEWTTDDKVYKFRIVTSGGTSRIECSKDTGVVIFFL